MSVVSQLACIWTYAPNGHKQCFLKSNVLTLMMVCVLYVFDIPLFGGSTFITSPTNCHDSITICMANFSKRSRPCIPLSHSLVTCICLSISGTCSHTARRYDFPFFFEKENIEKDVTTILVQPGVLADL